MCAPLVATVGGLGASGLLTSAATSVLGAGLSHYSAVQQQNVQSQIHKQNVENANKALQQEQSILLRQNVEEERAANTERLARQIEAEETVAQIENNAMARGGGGISMNHLMRIARMRNQMNQSAIDESQRNRGLQLHDALLGTGATWQGRVSSTLPSEKPSLFPYLIGAASNTLSSYNGY